MKTIMNCMAVFAGAMGIAAGAAAGNSSLAPLTQDVPVMIAQANQSQASDITATRSMGVCSPVSNSPESTSLTQNALVPKGNAWDYFHFYEHQDMGAAPATVTVLQSTKHGELSDLGDGYYVYLPEKGYVGQDKAIFLVDFGDGHKVKVVYFLKAIEGFFPSGDWVKEYCGKTEYRWKISTTIGADGNSTITSIDYLPGTPGAYQWGQTHCCPTRSQ